MSSPENVQLLKEYIKTFIATEVVFPGIPPRKWGVEFSLTELKSIYCSLTVILRKAHPLQDRSMLAAFEQINVSEARELHWFLYDYWREIVAILSVYPNWIDSYQFSQHLTTAFHGVQTRTV